METSIKKDHNFQEVLELWNEFSSLKEENNELNKILDVEKKESTTNSSNVNNTFINSKANQKDNMHRINENSDVVLYSYRKDNESNKTNGHSMYVSCSTFRNKD